MNSAPKKRTQGMNWIQPTRRLAIYLRDGMACAYCGASLEDDGVQLSLDHIVPYALGGKHESNNLITSCKRCNSSRGKRTVCAFAKAVAMYRNVEKEVITKHVRNCVRRSMRAHLHEARELIARRGKLSEVLKGKLC